MVSVAVEIRVAFRGGWRWPLRDTDAVEIWRGPEQLGVLSGETVRHLIQHHMTDFELRRRVIDELDDPRRAFVYVETLRKPLAGFTEEQRATFRAKRKERKA